MRTVLLVDNSGLFREVARTISRRTDCELLTADTGTAALATARRERPNLVFLDADMEGMSGIDVCRVLKADKTFAHTPVVLVGRGEKEEEEGMRAGADSFLRRDFSEEDFLATLRRH